MVTTGNRYNLHLWFDEFKLRVRECLRAQIKAIGWREGLSAGGGIIGLLVVFATMAFVAAQDRGDVELLIALAVTLPRQIEMTSHVHEFVTGWNDVLAHWTRWGGIISNMRPTPDPDFERRIQFDRLIVREGGESRECGSVEQALRLLLASPTGRINLRGGNASGKSSLLTALKSVLRKHSYYWPAADGLSFKFARAALLAEAGYGDDDEELIARSHHDSERLGFSSGERMLKALQEIVENTADAIYLFDEWDANLDAVNRIKADKLVDQLATRARVIEISHRDKELAKEMANQLIGAARDALGPARNSRPAQRGGVSGAAVNHFRFVVHCTLRDIRPDSAFRNLADVNGDRQNSVFKRRQSLIDRNLGQLPVGSGDQAFRHQQEGRQD